MPEGDDSVPLTKRDGPDLRKENQRLDDFERRLRRLEAEVVAIGRLVGEGDKRKPASA